MVMFGFLTQPLWSPYLAGAGIGILSCLALVLADRPLGCSTAFVKARGLIGKMINPEKTEQMAYYQDIVPKVDWQFTTADARIKLKRLYPVIKEQISA